MAKTKKKKNYSFNPTQLDDIPPGMLDIHTFCILETFNVGHFRGVSRYFVKLGADIVFRGRGQKFLFWFFQFSALEQKI